MTAITLPADNRSKFGSILAKWKQMDSASTGSDGTSLISSARHTSRRHATAYDAGKSTTGSSPRYSWKASTTRRVLKKSTRLFRSKRFETSVSTATTTATAEWEHTDDMSERLTEEEEEKVDPAHMITVKESKAPILAGDTFDDQYTLGEEVGYSCFVGLLTTWPVMIFWPLGPAFRTVIPQSFHQ